MFKQTLTAALAALICLASAPAQAREKLGFGHLLSNDFIGDGEDRWRSASYVASHVWGPAWQGTLPPRFGDLLELRLRADILAPANLTRPAPGDRPYAGTLSLGLHSHFSWHSAEVSLGADLVMTGADTGLGDLHGSLHDAFNVAPPAASVLDTQIGNGLHPTAVAEIGRSYALAPNAHIRPYAEGRAGAETLLRAGFDITIGQIGRGELLLRDPGTGQRYRAVERPASGYSVVFGADIAKVYDSIYLPENRGYTLTDTRDRARLGLHWQGEQAAAFYGITWAGKEFTAQSDDQLVGSLRIELNF
ncbi:MAG: lipid A-modifier LpxR family protein [Sulfitobacter sp.]